MTCPEQHRVKLHSTNLLKRLDKEVKRRPDVVGIFPDEDSIINLIGAVLFKQNDECQLQNRYMQIRTRRGRGARPNSWPLPWPGENSVRARAQPAPTPRVKGTVRRGLLAQAGKAEPKLARANAEVALISEPKRAV